MRQWVLSLPAPLRYRLAYDHTLCTAVHRILARAVRSQLRRAARKRGDRDVDTGSVTFVQRYGSGLNLNVHYHLLSLDGWFRETPDGTFSFVHAPTPSQEDVEKLVLRVYRRVLRLLQARGLLEEPTFDELSESSPILAACYEGAVRQRVALGPRRGRPVMKAWPRRRKRPRPSSSARARTLLLPSCPRQRALGPPIGRSLPATAQDTLPRRHHPPVLRAARAHGALGRSNPEAPSQPRPVRRRTRAPCFTSSAGRRVRSRARARGAACPKRGVADPSRAQPLV